jgi:hypothetical protein
MKQKPDTALRASIGMWLALIMVLWFIAWPSQRFVIWLCRRGAGHRQCPRRTKRRWIAGLTSQINTHAVDRDALLAMKAQQHGCL